MRPPRNLPAGYFIYPNPLFGEWYALVWDAKLDGGIEVGEPRTRAEAIAACWAHYHRTEFDRYCVVCGCTRPHTLKKSGTYRHVSMCRICFTVEDTLNLNFNQNRKGVSDGAQLSLGI